MTSTRAREESERETRPLVASARGRDAGDMAHGSAKRRATPLNERPSSSVFERARGVDEGNEAMDAPPGDDAMDASDDEAATPAEANQSRTRAADDPEAETSATAGGGAARDGFSHCARS